MPERDPFVPFSLTLDGAEEAVRDGLARAMACLAPLMLTPEEAGTVELVLAEALNNVVEHALAGSGGTTRIDIQGRHDAAGLHLLLIDRGSPMPDGKGPRRAGAGGGGRDGRPARGRLRLVHDPHACAATSATAASGPRTILRCC